MHKLGLELTDEQYDILLRKAEAYGIAPQEYLMRLISVYLNTKKERHIESGSNVAEEMRLLMRNRLFEKQDDDTKYEYLTGKYG